MSQLKKSLPIMAYFVFGALLYVIGYNPDSETYSKLIFNSCILLYTIWFIAAIHSASNNYTLPIVAFGVTFIISYAIPDNLITASNGTAFIISILCGMAVGITSRYLTNKLK